MNNGQHITYFAETDARNQRVKFGIKADDRTRHVYVIGKTGMGKSTVLENMFIQDINNGNGAAFIDPHGKTAELLLEYVPEHRIKDVLYFAPFDIEYPISFNVMEDVGPEKRHLVVNGLMSAFKKLFGEESFSDRMQYILQNAILALLEYPGATMLGINKLFTDKAYRDAVVANVTDPSVKAYWEQEFAGYTDRFAAEATPAIQNKIGQFTSNPLIRNIIGQPRSSFDIRKLMDEGKILVINLSKGLVGESNANLLGSMLITKIYLAAMSRADASPAQLAKLPNFYLFVDEFQSFANESFANILSEARKYKLNLTIAHQYIEQMSEEVRAAVFGNVGTMMSFRVGSYDAEVLEKEFAPYFLAQDIVNLDKYQLYLKLMIDGVASQPFSAVGLPPIEKPIISFTKNILDTSRQQFAHPRAAVEAAIREFQAPFQAPQQPQKKDKEGGVVIERSNEKPRQTEEQRPQKKQGHEKQKPKEHNTHKSNDRGGSLKDVLQNHIEQPKKPIVRGEDIEKAIATGELIPIEEQKPVRKEKESGSEEKNGGHTNLKSALAELLKQQNPTQKAPVSTKSEDRPVSNTQIQPTILTPQKVPATVPVSQNSVIPSPNKNEGTVSKNVQPRREHRANSSVLPQAQKDVFQASATKSTVQEVPEEVLRKVFDVNN